MIVEKYNQKKHSPEAVQEILAMALGRPTPERLHKIVDEFYNAEGHTLFISSDKGQITGIIGVDDTAAPHGWIIHLAVRLELRMRGIGKNLINNAIEIFSLKSIALTTDQDAVGFYRACGFEIKEIVSKWPGVRRFRCTKGHMPEFVLEYYDKLTAP
jgi:ribosomal protein S18 acetylase RimI-like enzyme